MAFTFTLKRPTNLTSVIKNLKQLAKDNNIACQGDETSGYGESHGIKARYEVRPTDILVTVEKKPLVVPNKIIEKEAKSFFDKFVKAGG